jgi:hypothetical protein
LKRPNPLLSISSNFMLMTRKNTMKTNQKKKATAKRIGPAHVGMLSALLLIMALLPTAASAADYANPTDIAAAPHGGFWIQVYGGGDRKHSRTLAVNGAPEFESVSEDGLIAAIPGQEGYWVIGSHSGNIYSRGTAPALCGGNLANCTGYTGRYNVDMLTAVAATPDGKGLWAVSFAGDVWAAGSAQSFGNVKKAIGRAHPTGIAATPSGKGYIVAAGDGGVFCLGDAGSKFFGSFGGHPPGGRLIVGLALSRDASGGVNGYWLNSENGNVYEFGAAPFLGSTGGKGFVTALTAGPEGRSYAWVYADTSVGQTGPPPSMTIQDWYSGYVWNSKDGNDPANPTVITDSLLPESVSKDWQLWRASTDSAAFQIFNNATGLCIDFAPADQTMMAIQYRCKGENEDRGSQLFRLHYNPNGVLALEPWSDPNSSLVPTQPGAYLVLSIGSTPSWRLLPTAKTVAIASAVSGQVIDQGRRSDRLEAQPADGSDSQQWTLRPFGANRSVVQLVNRASEECIELPADDEGSSPDAAPCDRNGFAKNQLWRVIVRSDASVEFAPLNHPDYRLTLDPRDGSIDLARQGRDSQTALISWSLLEKP